MSEMQSRDEQILKEIIGLVAHILKLPEEKIDPNANLFSDIGVDSLLGVEIFSALDKKYGINVPEEKLRGINSLQDIAVLVKELKPN